MTRAQPLGDRALIWRFSSHHEAALWAASAREGVAKGRGEIVLAYDSVAFIAEEKTDLDLLEVELSQLVMTQEDRSTGRLIDVPVLYDGPDLEEVANALGIGTSDIIELHSARVYQVFAIGFLPGFPYLGYLDPQLEGLGRRSSPRTRVPSGSVAIVGKQTGVYPQESPGGWHLIGRTPLKLADVDELHFPIKAGDEVRFVPISEVVYRQRLGELLR